MKIFYGAWSWPFFSLFFPIFKGLLHFPVHTPVIYVDWCFSLFCIIFKADTSSTFLWNRKKYFRRRQAFTSYPTQLPQVWGKCWLSQISTLWCQMLVKMLTFKIINTMKLGVGVMVPYAMVDVITILIVGRCFAYYCGRCCVMMWQKVAHWGRCYSLFAEQWQML